MNSTPLTGRKVFFMVAAFFGVIIVVNVTMAYYAIKTFPGLETRNSYVASQSFEDDRAAQVALGWNVAAVVSGENLVLSIVDAAGNPVRAAEISAILGRATHVKDDIVPMFEFDGVAYVAPVDIPPGNWNLRLSAVAVDGTKFQQRIVVQISN